MKKNLKNLILAALVVAGVFTVEINPFVSLCFIGFVGGVCMYRDLQPKKGQRKMNCVIEPEDEYLLDYETGLMY